MKKLILIICLALSFTLLCVNAGAALPAVVDNADLLAPAEESALEEAAVKLRTRGFDVVMLTLTGDYDGKSVRSYADDYFDYNGYGIGTDRTGVLLLINITERDIYVSTSGKAIYALTDYGIDLLLDDITPYFSEEEYARGFERFVAELERYVTAYENGAPIGAADEAYYLEAAIICLVIGAVISLLIMLGIKKGKLEVGYDADMIVVDNGFNLVKVISRGNCEDAV